MKWWTDTYEKSLANRNVRVSVRQRGQKVGCYYPVLLNMEGKNALVVGGGKVAQRKVEGLLACGASIHIISSELTYKLQQLIESSQVRYLGHHFNPKHLENTFLVIVATDDRRLNRRISQCARGLDLLINVADQPEDCNFILPSVVKRGDLMIAISTSGKSPALAKELRKHLETVYGGEYETFLALMGALRKEVLSKGLPQKQNSEIFHQIVQSGILQCLRNGDLKGVRQTLRKILPKDISSERILNDLM